MKYLLLLLLASPCLSQVIRSEGAISSVPSLTVTGNGSACLKSGPLNVDCATPSVTVTSSITVTGAGGLSVYPGGSFSQAQVYADFGYEISGGKPARGVEIGQTVVSGGGDSIGTIQGYYGSVAGALGLNPGGGNVGIGTPSPASKLHVSSGTITIDGTGSPTTSQALCLATGGAMGHCTSAVGAGGGCTCVSP